MAMLVITTMNRYLVNPNRFSDLDDNTEVQNCNVATKMHQVSDTQAKKSDAQADIEYFF